MSKIRVRDNASLEVFLLYIAETGLDVFMREICLEHKVTLREIFLDVRGPTVHAARLEVWWRLGNFRKSASEIARIFDREGSSVQHAMKRLEERAGEMGLPLGGDTVREIARSIADGVSMNRSKGAREFISRQNAARKESGE